MIMLSWNCRGARHEGFIPAFKNYNSRYKPDLFIIVEPRIIGSAALQIINKLGFDGRLVVDAQGFSGGIWVLWREETARSQKWAGRSKLSILKFVLTAFRWASSRLSMRNHTPLRGSFFGMSSETGVQGRLARGA
ncbi:hypothetical protein LINPERPRIM_LOCUS21741 [Linum perenne]